jgi:flavin-dependent dehydrogenase
LGGRVEIHQFPGGYAGLLGLGDGTLNLCLAADRRQLGEEMRIDALLETYLPQNPHLQSVLRQAEPFGAVRSTYPVYFPPRRAHADGVVLIGDAARVSEPVTGEGIFFALRSAAIAALTIDQALRNNDLSAARLSAYTLRCQREFRRRRALNALIRYIIYRPALLSPLLRWSRRNEFMLEPLVQAICTPENPS